LPADWHELAKWAVSDPGDQPFGRHNSTRDRPLAAVQAA